MIHTHNTHSEQKPLLLHSCCAPCASASVEQLLAVGRQVELFYYMPSIYSYEEYCKRLESLEILARYFQLQLHVGEYEHSKWLAAIRGLEAEKEGGARCFSCYEFVLHATHKKAQELDFDSFSTTLSISPYKNAVKINEIGCRYQGFEFFDFKQNNGYRRSIELSKKLGLYRQKFCACEFSKSK
ncbi:MAG: epoxyqueuosine reductase QueH [Bacteroidales bacterium]|jgi:predicted adenine nucleotide alpha hydrolase (AANH) superfamily ATPase|nr:epoxyqueuosine reductase QueH [Bacteroidales bacterium]